MVVVVEFLAKPTDPLVHLSFSGVRSWVCIPKVGVQRWWNGGGRVDTRYSSLVIDCPSEYPHSLSF